MKAAQHKTRGAVITRKAPRAPSQFDLLAAELADNAAVRSSTTRTERTNDIEYHHRMQQGRRLRDAGKLSAESLAGLQRIMLGGQLPNHIGEALDRACGD